MPLRILMDMGPARAVQFDFRLGPLAEGVISKDKEQFGQRQQAFMPRLLRRFYFNLPAKERRRRLVLNKYLGGEQSCSHHNWRGEAKLAAKVRGEIAMIQSQCRVRLGYKGFISIVVMEFYNPWPKSERLAMMMDG